jgi:2'-5' RNA ligase
MIRLFTAIEVPFDVAQNLIGRQHGVPGARWRDEQSLHITLRFYGEVQETAAADLDVELGRIRQAPFDLALTGVGSFGEGHQLHAIWAGVQDSEPLKILAGRCESAARRAQVPVESRTYRPHVTLAYLNRQADAEKVAGWIRQHSLLASPPFRVGRFGLYSSHLGHEGSRYELEREYPLA